MELCYSCDHAGETGWSHSCDNPVLCDCRGRERFHGAQPDAELEEARAAVKRDPRVAVLAKVAVHARTGRDRFVRNVLIAIGNSGTMALAASARALLDDASPLVRGASAWALRRLAPDEADALRAGALARESDAEVAAEWRD